jgi:hypothetical protein
MTTINVPYMDYFDRQTLAALTAPPVVEPEPEPQPQDDWSCATDGDLAPTGEWVTFKVSADIKPPVTHYHAGPSGDTIKYSIEHRLPPLVGDVGREETSRLLGEYLADKMLGEYLADKMEAKLVAQIAAPRFKVYGLDGKTEEKVMQVARGDFLPDA